MTLVSFHVVSQHKKLADMQCDAIPRVGELVVFDDWYIVTNVIWKVSVEHALKVLVHVEPYGQ